MPMPFLCPAGHRWQADPNRDGWLPACPECGAAGMPHPTNQTGLGETIGTRGEAPSPPGRPHVPGYEILSLLGRGGMGVVFLARQVKLGRLVALKMLPAGPEADPLLLARFRLEAEAIAALQHPNIIQIYEVGETQGAPWLALEYVAGGSLAAWLGGKPRPPEVAAPLVIPLARGIDHAHQRGILHRDLKPANVLLQKEGPAEHSEHLEKKKANKENEERTPRFESLPLPSSLLAAPSAGSVIDFLPRITDFGLARRIQDDPGATRVGEILGTPSYVAPEQASGSTLTPGPGVDVWALGAILYECLTGRPPFVGNTSMDTLLQVLSDEPVPPRQLNPAVPLDLDIITLKCLQKDPRRRYVSAAALADDLERFLRGEPILARPVAAWERLLKWARRRPVAAAFVTFALLGAAGFSTVVLRYNTSLRRQRDQVRQLYGEAEQARSDERQQRTQAEDRLLGRYLATSTHLMELGDPFAAIPLQVEALLLEAGGEREKMHRLRIGSTLARAPRLVQLWRHDGPVHDAALSAAGRLVVSGAEDGTARVWNTVTGDLVWRWSHPAAVHRVAFHPDGQLVATADASGAVRSWNVRTGKPLGPIHRHPGEVTSLAFSPDGRRLLSAARDGSAILQDVTGRLPRILDENHRPGAILFAGFSPDGQLVVTTSEDRTARVWRADSGKLVAGPLAHEFPVHHAIFSADARQLFTASGLFRATGGTGQVIAWDLADGRSRAFARRRAVRRLALDADGTHLLAAQHTGQLQHWDVSTGEPGPHGTHLGPVLDVVVSPDQRRVLTASADGTAVVWEPGDQILRVAPAFRHGAAVTRACFGSDGRQVLTASADGLVRLWDLAPMAPPVALFQPMIGTSRFSPDGRTILTAGYDGLARVWDAVAGVPRSGWMRHAGRIDEAVFAPDGRHLATAGQDGSVRVWETNTGNLVWLVKAHEGSSRSVTFRPDGSHLASGGDDGRVRLWDARTGRLVGEVPRLESRIRSVRYTVDGQSLLIVPGDGPARLHLLQPIARSGTPLLHGPSTRATLEAASLAPGGRWLATTSDDGVALLWDVGTGRLAGPPLRARAGLSLAVFDPPGKRLAALGMDRTAQVWEVPSGKWLAGPLAHPGAGAYDVHVLLSAAFNPEGSLLATGSSNALARVWDVARGELLTPPWLMPCLAVSSVAFHPDGRHLLISAWSPEKGGAALVRELSDDRMPGADLRLLGLVLAGQRVGSDGRLVDVGAEEIEQAWRKLRQRHPQRFTVSLEEESAWLRWEAEHSWTSKRTRGLETLLDQLARIDPGGWRSEWLRGQLLWQRGQPGSAAVAFARARQLGNSDDRSWSYEAACRLADGDHAGYRQVCAEALAQLGKTNVPEQALRLARLCLHRPDAVKDFAPVVSLARQACQHAQEAEPLAVLGAALLRNGQREAAGKVLEATRTQRVDAAVFLALLKARSEERETGRERIREARERLARTRVPAEEVPGLEAVLREAELLLEQAVRASPK